MRLGLLMVVFGLGLIGGAEGLRRSGEQGHDPRRRRWATAYRALGLVLVLSGGIIAVSGLVLA